MQMSDRARFSKSIAELFQATCRSHLMYDDREKKHFDRTMKDDRFDSCLDAFGGEHLIRLLAKMPELLYGLEGQFR